MNRAPNEVNIILYSDEATAFDGSKDKRKKIYGINRSFFCR